LGIVLYTGGENKMSRKLKFLISLGSCLFFVSAAYASHPIAEYFEHLPDAGKLESADWVKARDLVSASVPRGTVVTAEVQEAFYQIEERYYTVFSPASQSEYRDLLAEVGGKFKNLELANQIPTKQSPFWIEAEDEFKKFRSTATIPAEADIVVIGAGLTGSSTAYHLIEAAKAGQSIVILEADHPAAQSSGKNGGNFQLLPESYLGRSYEGLIEERLKWLKTKFSGKPPEALLALAEEQARTLVRFSFLNMDRIKKIVGEEKLQCDLSPNGWLRIASTPQEESAILAEIPWLESLGAEGIEVMSPAQIRDLIHIPAEYSGRLIRGSGNYHPYKFVKEILKKSLAQNIALYTGVRVAKVSPIKKGEVLLETSEGPLKAKRVIVATNAFTPRLFPELKGIQCVPSQIVTLQNTPNRLQGFTVTERYGDIYYNLPRSTHMRDRAGNELGMLLYGLDFSAPVPNPNDIAPSQALLAEQMAQIYQRFPELVGQPPSRVWVGPMGFSDDRVPTIGFLTEDVIIAAGFQGYGGSFCIEAGYVAAQMALTGETPAEVPEALFSPKRFFGE